MKKRDKKRRKFWIVSALYDPTERDYEFKFARLADRYRRRLEMMGLNGAMLHIVRNEKTMRCESIRTFRF